MFGFTALHYLLVALCIAAVPFGWPVVSLIGIPNELGRSLNAEISDPPLFTVGLGLILIAFLGLVFLPFLVKSRVYFAGLVFFPLLYLVAFLAAHAIFYLMAPIMLLYVLPFIALWIICLVQFWRQKNWRFKYLTIDITAGNSFRQTSVLTRRKHGPTSVVAVGYLHRRWSENRLREAVFIGRQNASSSHFTREKGFSVKAITLYFVKDEWLSACSTAYSWQTLSNYVENRSVS